MPVATTKTESTKAIATPINSNTKNVPTPLKNTPVATKTPNITTTKVVPATITKTAVNNTTATNKPLPNPKPSSSTATVESSKIQLIAGSFKDKANAEKLVGTLKSQGYKNAHVSEFNGNYQVAIDSYSTLSETMKALKQYKKDAWVKTK
jgi:cell division protein FtsN